MTNTHINVCGSCGGSWHPGPCTTWTTAEYTIPGGEMCTVCGLRFFRRSMGGPGICPACDCGFTGPALVEAQRKEIERRDQQLKESVDHETEYMAEIERLKHDLERAMRNHAADLNTCSSNECSGPLGHHVHRIGPGPCVYCGHTESSVLEQTEHHVTDSTDMPRPP